MFHHSLSHPASLAVFIHLIFICCCFFQPCWVLLLWCLWWLCLQTGRPHQSVSIKFLDQTYVLRRVIPTVRPRAVCMYVDMSRWWDLPGRSWARRPIFASGGRGGGDQTKIYRRPPPGLPCHRKLSFVCSCAYDVTLVLFVVDRGFLVLSGKGCSS